MRTLTVGSTVQAMADIFALGCIQSDVMFRNDEYIAAEKVGCLVAKLLTAVYPALQQPLACTRLAALAGLLLAAQLPFPAD